uniref:Uncharacterized protein n=1 Tax=Glossina brevipalpis TaxID=37001 RepID=A0A1A9WMX9_9MUSC
MDIETQQRKYFYTLTLWYLIPMLCFYLAFILKIGPRFGNILDGIF